MFKIGRKICILAKDKIMSHLSMHCKNMNNKRVSRRVITAADGSCLLQKVKEQKLFGFYFSVHIGFSAMV